jgi:hypothetical protein
MRAALLRQRDRRNELQGTLNDGKPGWNDDEPAVVELVCQMAVRRFFADGRGMQDIATVVDAVQQASEDDMAVDRLEVEALIRKALGEDEIGTKSIGNGKKFILRIWITGAVVFLLNLDEATVDETITDSELLAFEQGWKPPLVRKAR